MDFNRARWLIALVLFALIGCAEVSTPPPTGKLATSLPINGKFSRAMGLDSASRVDSLMPIFPNPFSSLEGDSSVHISFVVKDTSRVLILIQNPIGDEVVRFSDSMLVQGTYHGDWVPNGNDGTALSTGLYFITLRVEPRVISSSGISSIDSLHPVIRSRLLNVLDNS
jgi:hypothetical protein